MIAFDRFPVHALFEVTAFAVAAWVYGRGRRADVLPEQTRGVIVAGAAVGALVGSRLLALLEHPGLLDGAGPARTVLLLYATKTIVGGLLGGLVGVELVKAWIGERRRSGDAFVYPLVAAIAVGRVGCHLAGVADGTAGLPTDAPWGLDQGDGVPRHPMALFEIGVVLAVGAVLTVLERRRPLRPGVRFALFMTGYLAWRLGAELLKPVVPLALGLSAIQWACALGLLQYLRLFSGRRFGPSLFAADRPCTASARTPTTTSR